MRDADYRDYIRRFVTANGWRSLGQVGWFQHQETGQRWDAFAVATDEEGVKRPVWKLLAAQGCGPQATPLEEVKNE